MPDHENERGGAIVDDRCGLCAANESERAFQIGAAMSTVTTGKMIFEICVNRSDLAEQFHRRRRERGATEVRMNNNAGAIDYGLQTRTAQIVERSADAGEQGGEGFDAKFFAP